MKKPGKSAKKPFEKIPFNFSGKSFIFMYFEISQKSPFWASETPWMGTVLHAVAVDPLYQSSAVVIQSILEKIFAIAQDVGAERIALTALATGFGNLSLSEFADGLHPFLDKEYSPIKEIVICQIEDYRFEELKEAFSRESFDL